MVLNNGVINFFMESEPLAAWREEAPLLLQDGYGSS